MTQARSQETFLGGGAEILGVGNIRQMAAQKN